MAMLPFHAIPFSHTSIGHKKKLGVGPLSDKGKTEAAKQRQGRPKDSGFVSTVKRKAKILGSLSLSQKMTAA